MRTKYRQKYSSSSQRHILLSVKTKKTILVPAVVRSRDPVSTRSRNRSGDVEYGEDNDKSVIIKTVPNLS